MCGRGKGTTDKFPVLWNERPVGELQAEQCDRHTDFTACCHRLPAEGLWCVWLTGESGELRLGIMEQGHTVLRRRFSRQMTASLGTLCYGELRAAGRAEPLWETCEQPEKLLRPDWLSQRLPQGEKVLIRRRCGRTELAVPYDPHEPFPLLTLFCFARCSVVGGRRCMVFSFNAAGDPVFL